MGKEDGAGERGEGLTMGVPAFYRWLSEKYPKIVVDMLEDRTVRVEGTEIPLDLTKENPNGIEVCYSRLQVTTELLAAFACSCGWLSVPRLACSLARSLLLSPRDRHPNMRVAG